MKRNAFKLLAEKYSIVSESVAGVTEGSSASKEQVLHSVTNLIDNNLFVNGIEIQTHYGNVVLPVIEIWEQDGTIKISVDHSKLEGQ